MSVHENFGVRREIAALGMVLSLASALVHPACQPRAQQQEEAQAPAPPSVATVSGQPFPTDLLERELAFIAATSAIKPQNEEEELRVKRSILEGLIDQSLVLEAAREKGIELPEGALEREMEALRAQYPDQSFEELLREIQLSEQEFIERRRQRLLVEHYFAEEIFARQAVTEAEIEAHYQVHVDELSAPEEVRAAHIVVSTNDEAITVLRELKAGLKFDEAARRYSIAPEGRLGGDLGFFPRGVMPPVFDKACFELPVGRVSEIVPSDYGFHIFKVLEKRPARRRGYAQSHPIIERQLMQRKFEEAEREHMSALRAAAKISIDLAELQRVRIRR